MDKTVQEGKVYIVSAPSGAGKTSLLRALQQQEKSSFGVCVSHTTRKPRRLEKTGEHYHFISKQQFKQMVEAEEFIEYAEVFDHCYGTSKQAVLRVAEQGLDVILEIDWQGAQQAKKIFGDQCISIFILPPSLAVLFERLEGRGQDAVKIIESRMREAKSEISHANEFDYLILNDQFEIALLDLMACFRAGKLQTKMGGLAIIQNVLGQ